MITVKGTLRSPMNLVTVNTEIRVTALENTGDTLLGLAATSSTDADGAYEFQLVEGKHKIEVLFVNERTFVGGVHITDTLDAEYSLPALLNAAAFDIGT